MRYVPYPVISGFMSGIGVIIITQQVFPMLGANAPGSDPWSILSQLHLLGGNIRWSAVALSASTIAIALLLPRFTKVIPASLVALTFPPRFELRHTCFMVAGIAGIAPQQGTVGAPAWAKYFV
ncbi:SulP family inorganic anion transporter, partial [Paraburkholderia sp. SIMBA_061]